MCFAKLIFRVYFRVQRSHSYRFSAEGFISKIHNAAREEVGISKFDWDFGISNSLLLSELENIRKRIDEIGKGNSAESVITDKE